MMNFIVHYLLLIAIILLLRWLLIRIGDRRAEGEAEYMTPERLREQAEECGRRGWP